MVQKKNHYKATVILGIVSAGFLATYPYQTSFVGGLFYSGFRAAMIGGLADWFAVTALFRKPLGISSSKYIRTDIIPNKRKYILSTLVDMVENELLTKENLKNKLKEIDIPEVIIRFVNEQNGKEDITKILQNIIKDVLNNVDSDDVAKFIEDLVKERATKIKISPLIVEIIESSIKHGYDKRITLFVIDEIIRLAKHTEMNKLIKSLLMEAKDSYEGGKLLRKLLDKLLLSPSKINTVTDDIQKYLVQFLEEMKDPNHSVRKYLQGKIHELVMNLKYDEKLSNKIENWKEEKIKSYIKFQVPISNFLNSFREKMNVVDNKEQAESFLFDAYKEVAATAEIDPLFLWIERVEDYIENFTNKFKSNLEQRAKLDMIVKKPAVKWIDEKHSLIGKMVKDSLDKFSNDMLIDFIERKAGNDLQLIRINGSLVGGIAGILIYLFTFWV
jgi:uncharacterized membrane-anchored protein YjiN (DUF445 family)